MKKNSFIKQEKQLEILRYIKNNPNLTQRSLAQNLNISLGKLNYFIHELIKTRTVKIEKFSKSKSKSDYSYLLTTRGLAVKTKLTYAFMVRKFKEYEALKKEYYDTNKKS